VPRHITVLGAGIVGVATACSLQRDGHQVTLVDRLPPGEYCSSGNAGLLCPSWCTPLLLPGTWRRVPHWLRDPLGPLTVRWGEVPKLAPWFARAFGTLRGKRWLDIAGALRRLTAATFDAYEPLARDAGASDLIRRDGYLIVYEREDTWRKDALDWQTRRDFGVRMETLDRAGLRALEPGLGQHFVRGLHLPDEGHVRNPLRLTQQLAAHFVRQGGALLQRDVLELEVGAAGPRALVTDGERVPVETLVLCAGIHSSRFAARLGSPVPLATQRGYHAHVEDPGVALQRPTMSGEGKFFATPMEHGVRVAGTVEFASVEAEPDYRRSDVVLARARTMLPKLGGTKVTRWMGHRPCLPDSLPVIGPSPQFGNVYYAFGHGHIGLCTAAVTGRLVAEMIGGKPASIDPAPYRVDRF